MRKQVKAGRWLATIGASLALSAAVEAQPASSAPGAVKVIEAERRAIERDANGYSGAGWEQLVDDAKAAQFTMVGEQHGSGDIARMATVLHAELAASGYTHGGLEIGPFSTRFAEALIREEPGALTRFIAVPGNGFTLPFLFFAEEIALAEQMVARSPDKQEALWGLDQEFVGAVPVLGELLSKRARTVAQKTAVTAFLAGSRNDKLYLVKAGETEIAALENAFAGDSQAVAILAEIRSSRAIYDPFFNRGSIYPANLARETGMKRNFLRAFDAAEKRLGRPPKVFFKFGGTHAMRGHTSTDVPALGNFLGEWGESRGFRMVNLMIDCDGGEALDPQSGKPVPCKPYFGADTAIGKVVAAGPPLQIINLRALRPQLRKMKDADPLTRQTILAFDYYVAIRGGKAATPVGDTPAP